MTADPTARQSDWISTFRTDLRKVLDTLTVLDSDNLKCAALGGTAAFVPAAFTGSTNGSTNADLTAADLDAAKAGLTALRAVLFDPATGLPTVNFLAILKVAR